MRWLRLSTAIYSAKHKSELSITDVSKIKFRVWPMDIDVSIMNHAAMMTVMEMGRIDYMVRTGFFELARKMKWYFPIRGISAQFLRPLKLFQRANLFTRVFHVDESWFYIEQKILRKGKIIAICIVRATVKKGRIPVSTNEILKELNIDELPIEGKNIIDSYEKEIDLVYKRLREF